MHDTMPGVGQVSLHVRIRQDITSRILSGEWLPGHRIPTEHELELVYGCARATVSKALAALAHEGLVVRNRRAGTVVASPRFRSAVLDIPDIRAEVEARGSVYGYQCLLSELRAPCCVHLGQEGHELGHSRFVRALHLANGMPMMLEDRHIFLDVVPAARDADFTTVSASSWLLAHVPWTEGEHRIAAVSADGAVARALELATGAACLFLNRRTWRATETVTIVRQWYRGDSFDLTARFRPRN